MSSRKHGAFPPPLRERVACRRGAGWGVLLAAVLENPASTKWDRASNPVPRAARAPVSAAPACAVAGSRGDGDVHFAAGGATAASGWLLRLSASATKPDAFISSTKSRR